MKYLFGIFFVFVFYSCIKKGAHCQGTVLSKYNYLVPYAVVNVETYRHSGSKLRGRKADTTDINGYFDIIYMYKKGDVVKISIESDSGKLYEDVVQGNREFRLK